MSMERPLCKLSGTECSKAKPWTTVQSKGEKRLRDTKTSVKYLVEGRRAIKLTVDRL